MTLRNHTIHCIKTKVEKCQTFHIHCNKLKGRTYLMKVIPETRRVH